MPREPRHHPAPPVPQQDSEATAILGPVSPSQERRGSGGSGEPFDEGELPSRDAFDYPSPAGPHAWPPAAETAGAETAAAETPDADMPGAGMPGTATEPVTAHAGSGATTSGRAPWRNRARRAGPWSRMPGRHRQILLGAAVLVSVGGFGFALSLVDGAVSSDPTPGGPVPASEPKSPASRSAAPEPTASVESPSGVGAGGAGAATATRGGPSSGDADEHGDERGRDRKDDHEREDGDDDLGEGEDDGDGDG